MIGYLRTRVRKQPIIALYFEFETVLKFYYPQARSRSLILLKVGLPNLEWGCNLDLQSVTFHLGVNVSLTLTSCLISRVIVSWAYFLSILFDVEISNFACERILALLIVAYYFGVTATLTLNSVLYKLCTGHISNIIWHRNPKNRFKDTYWGHGMLHTV